MEGEWSYINPHSDFINSLWAVASYATKPWSKLVEGNVKANILLKLMFMIAARTRMFLDFYDFPIEYMLAKRMIR
jgi:hypothetical protein